MSKGKKQDSTEKKRERADLVARILQQRCPELRDLKYQNFEATNGFDPPDLVFGELSLDTGAFPVGIELMEFHRGPKVKGGSLLRQIEEQKSRITSAAWEKFRASFPDEYLVLFFWHESDGHTHPKGALPLDRTHSNIADKLISLIAAQVESATTEGTVLDHSAIENAGLSASLKSVYLAKFMDEGRYISNWSSFSAHMIGVHPEEIEQYIEGKSKKAFKQQCGEKWLVLVTDIEDSMSTYMKFIEFRSIGSQYFDRVLRLKLKSQRLDMISPELRVL
jgi:hypothetical protein